jgi:hypothetical protein
MKTITHTSIFILLLIVQSSYSQTSGYLGRKTAIGVQSQFSLSINNTQFLLAIEEKAHKSVQLNVANSIHLQRIVAPSRSLSFRFLHMRSSFPVDRLIEPYTGQYGKMKTNGLIFSANFFKIPYAPLGQFRAINVGLLFSNASIEHITAPSSAKKHMGVSSKSVLPMLGFASGKQTIQFKRLLVRQGFELNIVVPGLYSMKKLENRDYTKTRSIVKTGGAFLINYSIGFMYI